MTPAPSASLLLYLGSANMRRTNWAKRAGLVWSGAFLALRDQGCVELTLTKTFYKIGKDATVRGLRPTASAGLEGAIMAVLQAEPEPVRVWRAAQSAGHLLRPFKAVTEEGLALGLLQPDKRLGLNVGSVPAPSATAFAAAAERATARFEHFEAAEPELAKILRRRLTPPD